MVGQYTFFVATSVPLIEVSVCSIAVLGPSYVRDGSVVEKVEIEAGGQSVLSVSHIVAVHATDNPLAIDLRQQAGSNLPFVALANWAASADVIIDVTGVTPGEYTLVLESFDANNGLPELTLKFDIITIVVIETIEGASDTLPYFVAELEPKAIISG